MYNALHSPTFHRFVDDVLRDAAGPALGMAATPQRFDTAYDVRSSADAILIECDVPGVTEADLEITVEKSRLVVKGQRRYRGNDDERVLLGRRYGAFQKTFNLPEDVQSERLTAKLAHGVLTLRAPKQPAEQPRRISIASHDAAPHSNE